MLTGLVIAAGVAGILWWSGNLGKVNFLLKGFTNLFVQRAAQTMEGLEAAYVQAIDDMQTQRSEIAGAFQEISGLRQKTELEVS